MNGTFYFEMDGRGEHCVIPDIFLIFSGVAKRGAIPKGFRIILLKQNEPHQNIGKNCRS